MSTTLLWLRRDLRLQDLPALLAAHEQADGGAVLPVFVLDANLLKGSPVRATGLLRALESAQRTYDGAIVLRTGPAHEVIPALVAEVGATSVHISVETTPYGRERDARVRDALPADVPLIATGSPYAVGPGIIRSGSGTPYKVFTPFARAWRDHGWPAPAQVPDDVRWHRGPASEPLPVLPQLAPGTAIPDIGEDAAREQWAQFLDDNLDGYSTDRDRPDLDVTSRMSVQLKYGTIHPRTLLADLAAHPGAGRGLDAVKFSTEVAWREFYADVLWHNPASAWTDLRDSLAQMSYDDPITDPLAHDSFVAWQEGRTGYPLVDAGMRQLLAEGWMHNRVRMVTASFLVKHLHIWWPHGARHFLKHLLDGDIASNNHGWQWVAGTGTDASPYFRVFNPTTQAVKFDPQGDYIRRFIPELRHLHGKALFEPWLSLDGLAHGYPEPIVDHKQAREEALLRYGLARG